MKQIRARRPSPAMAVALLALFVALGGSGYAAFRLPKNSVGSRQLRDNSVTGAKVKNRTLTKSDFKKGQLPQGAQGPQGVQGSPGLQGSPGQNGAPGQQGPAGTARAYAHVYDSGGTAKVDTTGSKGITSANVTHGGAGRYCFGGLGFTPSNIQVTLGLLGGDRPQAQIPSTNLCPTGFRQFEVDMAVSGTASNGPVFYLLVN